MRRVFVVLFFVACGSSSKATSDGGGGSGGADSGSILPDGSSSSGLVPSSLGGGTDVPGSLGCSASSAPTGLQNLAIDGRTGVFFVPADYDPAKAYPIVFVFHGDGGTGAAIRTQLELEPDAAGKAIFAYPDGASHTWDATLAATNADMTFVIAVRSQLRTSYCIDTTRTFLTGMSRGGFFVNQLACMYGVAEFAAIAPHSSTIEQDNGNAYVYGPPHAQGGPYQENNNFDFACPSDGSPFPAHPVLPPPTMVIHGECDTEGGVEYLRGRMVAEHWGYAAQCSTTPAVAVTTSPNPSCTAAALTSNPTLTVDPCYKAPGCTAGHDITFCAIPSMDHRIWASAHTKIWAFFATH